MKPDDTTLDVTLPPAGFDPAASLAAVQRSGLEELCRQLAPGPFGLSAVATKLLESLVESVDLGLAAAHDLRGLLLQELNSAATGFHLRQLSPPHQRLLSAFQMTVTADRALSLLAEVSPSSRVEDSLGSEGLEDLLTETNAVELARRQWALIVAYSRHRVAKGLGDSLADVVDAAVRLLRRTVLEFARGGALRPLVLELARRPIRVAGVPYDGLVERRPRAPEHQGLMPIEPEQIVGNEDYLQAGLRLARDVAGFDFAAGTNPKRIQPVLFGLGAPGCGKTVTAHAIGSYFLRYCAERHVPARFVVVRRSDWASSYQNASAANLIRIFREEVYGFEGVCAVYWPDIDTAIASRSAAGLRVEEQQNLGAVFGIFDGTLLPQDGKWFMICDANTLHMDEAAISRIAQHPFQVAGPTTREHYARLIRELGLHDVASSIPHDPAAWQRIGQAAMDHRLSGRDVEALCGRLRSTIQDFEYPDEYFSADSEQRREILRRASRPIDETHILQAIEAAARFRTQAMEEEERRRFEDDVQTAVRQLNAGREALGRVEE